jgi:K+-transporting ATPase ATPase C chain
MKTIIISVRIFLFFTILTGILYPLFMTGLAQLCFPYKANGSLIMKEGKIIGSELIGQKFDSNIYFWSRPSAIGYNPVPSAASNYGPTSDTLKKLVTARRILFANENSITDMTVIPAEMVFASGSGLDPHISPQAALLQVDRVSSTRNFDPCQKQRLLQRIKDLTESPQFLVLGEKRINVLLLNLELDRIKGNKSINN